MQLSAGYIVYLGIYLQQQVFEFIDFNFLYIKATQIWFRY